MQTSLSVILVYTRIKFLYTRKALDASMSEMMSAPTVQHNQTKNNDTHMIASCVGANISPIHPSMTHISITQTDTLLICRSQVLYFWKCHGARGSEMMFSRYIGNISNVGTDIWAIYRLVGRIYRLYIDYFEGTVHPCLLYTSPSPRDATLSRMPSSA